MNDRHKGHHMVQHIVGVQGVLATEDSHLSTRFMLPFQNIAISDKQQSIQGLHFPDPLYLCVVM